MWVSCRKISKKVQWPWGSKHWNTSKNTKASLMACEIACFPTCYVLWNVILVMMMCISIFYFQYRTPAYSKHTHWLVYPVLWKVKCGVQTASLRATKSERNMKKHAATRPVVISIMYSCVISYFWQQNKYMLFSSSHTIHGAVATSSCVQSLGPLQPVLQAVATDEKGVGVNLCDPEAVRWSARATWSISQLDAAHLNSFLSYISLTPLLQSPPADWKTHTHTRNLLSHYAFITKTHTHTCRVLQHFFGSAKAVVLRCVWLPPSSPSLQVYHQLLVLEKKKKKWRKGPSRLVPMATALLFSCSAQSIRQRPSSCPAPAWLKRRGAGVKYHFRRFWCSGYFWVIFTHSMLFASFPVLLFACSFVTSIEQKHILDSQKTMTFKKSSLFLQLIHEYSVIPLHLLCLVLTYASCNRLFKIKKENLTCRKILLTQASFFPVAKSPNEMLALYFFQQTTLTLKVVFERKVIIESHSQLVQNWRFGNLK